MRYGGDDVVLSSGTVQKRICVLVCRNGLGHFRRIVTIVHALNKRGPLCRVDVVCARWQVEQLTDWPALKTLTAQAGTTFIFLDLYPCWHDAAASPDRRLLTWHEWLRPLGLDQYDLVVSDNLVEALYYQPETVLSGSFLWHDVYERAFPDVPLLKEYAQRSQALLRDHRPAMIANRYFAMPAIREQTQPVEVGMLPFATTDASAGPGQVLDILFAGGSYPEIAETMGAYLGGLAASGSIPGAVRLWMDRRVAGTQQDLPGLHRFDYDRQRFAHLDAVVARPGMGVISDCIATGTPLFCIHEANPEMQHNASVLEALGLGWRLLAVQEAVDYIVGWYRTPGAYETYRQRIAQIDNQGLEQTVDFLLKRLEAVW